MLVKTTKTDAKKKLHVRSDKCKETDEMQLKFEKFHLKIMKVINKPFITLMKI